MMHYYAPAPFGARRPARTTPKMILQLRSVGNRPQVGKLQHQQLHPTMLEMDPGLGAIAAPLAPAHHTAAEGLMDDVRADREFVTVGRLAIFRKLARTVV